LQLINENWQKSPVIDIRIDENPCNSEEENMFAYKWPGLVPGCMCDNEVFNEEECQSKDKKNCVELNELLSEQILTT